MSSSEDSSFTESSSLSSSLMPFLKPLIASPRDLPSPGIRFGPKIKSTIITTMRICQKPQIFAKSCNGLGWNFYSCVFRCKHRFLHFIVRRLKIVARTGFWATVGWVRLSFCCLNFCFWARTVLYIKWSIDNGCLQEPFSMSFQWTKVLPERLRSLQWSFHCFSTRCWTVEYLYHKRYFSGETWKTFLMWVDNRMTFHETLASS